MSEQVGGNYTDQVETGIEHRVVKEGTKKARLNRAVYLVFVQVLKVILRLI